MRHEKLGSYYFRPRRDYRAAAEVLVGGTLIAASIFILPWLVCAGLTAFK